MTGRRTYVERAGLGWRLVAEAAPSATGLSRWVVVRRWRLGRGAALRTRADAERSLEESIVYWQQRRAAAQAKRAREVLRDE